MQNKKNKKSVLAEQNKTSKLLARQLNKDLTKSFKVVYKHLLTES